MHEEKRVMSVVIAAYYLEKTALSGYVSDDWLVAKQILILSRHGINAEAVCEVVR